MKKLKKMVIALFMVFAMVSPIVLPIAGNVAVAEAATVKITPKTLTMDIGKTKVLKITGTKAKITWKSSDKNVATVSSKGNVTAKNIGTAKITATVGTKKYTCTVTVNDPGVEVIIGDISILIPTYWNCEVLENEDTYEATITPYDLKSNITVRVAKTGEVASTFDAVKAYYAKTKTKEYYEEAYTSIIPEAVISNFEPSSYVSQNGKAYVYRYTATLTDSIVQAAFYELSMDNYFVEVVASDEEEVGLDGVAAFILDSIIVIN